MKIILIIYTTVSNILLKRVKKISAISFVVCVIISGTIPSGTPDFPSFKSLMLHRNSVIVKTA